jgi:hypothetical protein
MMIKSVQLKNLRSSEFVQFISNVLKIVGGYDPAKLKVQALYDTLNDQQQLLAATLQQSSQHELTPQLAQLDKQRDEAIICLRQVSEGYTHHPSDEARLAGEMVLHCISKYGNRLYQLNYSAETAILKNLVKDLTTSPDYVKAVKALGMQMVVDTMQQTNQQFEDLFLQRMKEFSQEESSSTTELIGATTEAYRTLIQHLSAHATLTPSATNTELINYLNENVDHFNQLVERRKSSTISDILEEEIVEA